MSIKEFIALDITPIEATEIECSPADLRAEIERRIMEALDAHSATSDRWMGDCIGAIRDVIQQELDIEFPGRHTVDLDVHLTDSGEIAFSVLLSPKEIEND